jgi:NAD dependent epimerase/dehydratase family enzyme
MRVVITGGTGLVGRALARSLAHDGHDLVVLTRDPAAAARVLPAGTQALRWGGGSPGEWSSAVDGADAVVNLAGANLGEARWTAARKELIRHSRLGSVEAVAEAVSLAARPPAVVVQASAVGYYGYRGDEILDEGAEAGQDYMAQAVLVAAAWPWPGAAWSWPRTAARFPACSCRSAYSWAAGSAAGASTCRGSTWRTRCGR